MHLRLPFRSYLLIVGFLASLSLAPALSTEAQDSTPMAAARPNAGFELHIDAKAHFPGETTAIAHHFCKAVAGDMIRGMIGGKSSLTDQIEGDHAPPRMHPLFNRPPGDDATSPGSLAGGEGESRDQFADASRVATTCPNPSTGAE